MAAQTFPQKPAAERCFDVLVFGKIVGQTPSDPPNLGDGNILMSWPYFIDLKITRVNKGKIGAKKITALSVQHTYWRSDLGTKKWWLRRNTEGGYNILTVQGGHEPPQCSAAMPPATAYLTPAPGQTLDDMRKAGKQRYGSRP
ncbi:hypothetical protein [Stakelama marina]|uniref:Uncharacterized protein n=1 Tax=Stakelama marina TaxID=2826939 RepID=A0A8T4IEC0_9SPHN|nr:hypothetical protein [Stakelama marina]MBR0552910.1 hypothetical protein [Stakelama marina]